MTIDEWCARSYNAAEDHVLITGASSGIGREYLHAFARIGCRCIATSEDGAALAEAAAEARSLGAAEVAEIVSDLSKTTGVEDLLSGVASYGIAVLINCAGFGVKGPFLSKDPGVYAELVGLNALAPTLITRGVLPGMLSAGRGLVVHVASVNACTPIAYNAVYTATKAYLLYYAYAVSYELRGSPVVFQVVLPGTTNTPFHHRQGAIPQAMFMEPSVVVRRSLDRVDRSVCVSNYADRVLFPIVSALPLWARVRVGTYFLKKRLKIGSADPPA